METFFQKPQEEWTDLEKRAFAEVQNICNRHDGDAEAKYGAWEAMVWLSSQLPIKSNWKPSEESDESGGLEEEYKDYVERDPVYSKLVNRNAGLSIARHFAQWGAEHTPLPEDTVLFNKGVEEGKRLMMEERETEKDEPKPKFAVGDVVCRKGWADHTIKELFIGEEPVYICTNDEGIESHIPFSEQNKWELIQKKPNYCHHEVYETGWTEEYRKGFYHGCNDCNQQYAQLKKEQMINNQETIKLAEDHAFLAGADWQKEQMMKEAVKWLVDDDYDTKTDKGGFTLGSVGIGYNGYYIPYSDLLKLPKED